MQQRLVRIKAPNEQYSPKLKKPQMQLLFNFKRCTRKNNNISCRRQLTSDDRPCGAPALDDVTWRHRIRQDFPRLHQ